MHDYLIHIGNSNSGRFKKGSVGNTPKSREALSKKGKKSNKKGTDRTQNTVSKNSNKKLNSISNDQYKKFEKIASDVIRGNYGNGEVRKQKMKKAGYDYDTVQNIVNNRLIGTKLNFTVEGQKSSNGTRRTRRTRRSRTSNSSRSNARRYVRYKK